MSESEELHKGLEGVLVAESALSYIDGSVGKLVYRGYAIEDLAQDASYEEVLHLLWHGHLPDSEELDAFTDAITEEAAVDDTVLDALAGLAEADEQPMAALRSGVSMLSAADPDDADPRDLEASLEKGRRIVAKIPTLLAAYDRLRRGEDPIEPRSDLSLAANFLYMLTGEVPDDASAEAMDQALVLHADHGLNASTFTSMVVASTFADMYSSVTAGVGALSGPLHGGANQDVMELFFEIEEQGADPVDYVTTKQEQEDGWRVPGYGHRVYKVKDPRAKILEKRAKELSEASGDTTYYDYAKAIETFFTEEKGLDERGIAPNVDFFSGTVYHQLGIPVDMFTPIFALSRAGGWIGHVLEYQEDNRLIRPRGRYVGPENSDFTPLDER
ncbi:citrate synthase [Haloglomus litoreum]|uniref:citrate synthase n=1 Tax=Haloglomus litoreum TaxID=3034026 RepID=UPI0023E7903C|nr:citrate synthase [Haloglomus sp. DT116]